MLFRADRRSGEISSHPATVRVLDAEDAGTVPRSGAVQSVQEAEVFVPRELLDEMWKSENLERLARAYWRWLTS